MNALSLSFLKPLLVQDISTSQYGFTSMTIPPSNIDKSASNLSSKLQQCVLYLGRLKAPMTPCVAKSKASVFWLTIKRREPLFPMKAKL